MINRKGKIKMETVYIAGGCLWGVQHFFDTVPGVQMTEAGRANGTTSSLDGPYDGYAECVKVVYDEKNTSISELMAHLFEIIDPLQPEQTGRGRWKKVPDRAVQYRSQTSGRSKSFYKRPGGPGQDHAGSAAADKLCPER